MPAYYLQDHGEFKILFLNRNRYAENRFGVILIEESGYSFYLFPILIYLAPTEVIQDTV